ncbi:hypothetical protein AgCh_001584 [Apium graveolens]
MDNEIEEEFEKDNICMPSTPPKEFVCRRPTILPGGDLAKKKFKLSTDSFGEVGSTPEKSQIQARESNCIEIQEIPQVNAVEVKSVIREEACSNDKKYKIQTQQNLRIVVVGLSSPASTTPLSPNFRKRRATPLKQNPRKRRNSSTDMPAQKPKLRKSGPKILNDEDNTKWTPNTQVSESYFELKTPAMSFTRKPRTKRTFTRKNCSKLFADSLKNIQSVAATRSCKQSLNFDLENTSGDGSNLYEKDDQAAKLELVEKVEKLCSLPVHHKIFKINKSLGNKSRGSVLNFPKIRKQRKRRRLVHILGISCRSVKTAEVRKRSNKGIDLNMKLDSTYEEDQTALESPDMYSAVKMRKRRLDGSTQRPFINVTSFPKEDPLQLEEDFTKNHDAKVGKRIGLATKEKGNRQRWKNLQQSDENHGQVLLQDQNAGSSIDPQKKHKFRAKVDLDEETERVYNLLMSNGGNIYDQEAEADFEKKEYWDRERNSTRIRVESFISTIGMIQGDRSFSPWKGSIVDSVVGAFLTQNVCDHFSSSAFMSLAAQFPNHKLNGRSKNLCPEKNDLWPSADKTDPSARSSLEFDSHLPSYIKIKYKDGQEKETSIESEKLRKNHSTGRARDEKAIDIVDWEAVRQATVEEIAEAIKQRGMNNVIAGKIKDFLNKIIEEHGSPDLEWLRDVPPEEAKNYLLKFYGIGEKSVECIRLLTLHHVAFPVDTNVRRVAVRLGWVPLKPLPGGLQMHLLEMYPVVKSIQKYLYPRLCTLDQEKLYLLHYHLITFGKVFCTKRKPNCNACPMRGECNYFASAFASRRLSLPAPESKDIVIAQNLVVETMPLVVEIDLVVSDSECQLKKIEAGSDHRRQKCEPIVEHPPSPEPAELEDIEDLCKDSEELSGLGNYDDDDIPIIRIDNEACMENIIEYAKRYNISLEGDMSKILSLLDSAAPLPLPPLKHVGRLRTVHQVYELPDDHPILDKVDRRDPDDPSPYLFAVWNEGKDKSSISHTSSSGKQVRYKIICNCAEPDCESLVCGTLLIPVRSANHGTFPLNGTYFQVNEVFADDESTQRPIVIPRNWLSGLTRKNLYCGTSPTATFKGFTLYHIQHALCRGFFCNRGFNRKTRHTTTLGSRFHINTMQKKKKPSAVNSYSHAL